jgi:LmbE family N-acetylglucosaminyl deacetylase
MNILAIAAHPDDVEYGCGGTLAKYSQNGHKVFLLIMSEGEMGGPGNIRKAEQIEAAKILKTEEIFWGGYQDTSLPVGKNIISKIEGFIHRIKPDFIFVHYFDDTHQDHRHLSLSTISATRYIRNVLFFEGPTTQNFSPNVFVDISKYFDTKVQSLKAHESQVAKTNIEGLNIIDIASSTAIFRGIQSRVKYAEGFHSLRLFINV